MFSRRRLYYDIMIYDATHLQFLLLIGELKVLKTMTTAPRNLITRTVYKKGITAAGWPGNEIS